MVLLSPYVSEFEVRSQDGGGFEVIVRHGRRRPLRLTGFRTARDAQEWIDIRCGRVVVA
jgi:hypothetical protein